MITFTVTGLHSLLITFFQYKLHIQLYFSATNTSTTAFSSLIDRSLHGTTEHITTAHVWNKTLINYETSLAASKCGAVQHSL
jgi:hypothetical protein